MFFISILPNRCMLLDNRRLGVPDFFLLFCHVGFLGADLQRITRKRYTHVDEGVRSWNCVPSDVRWKWSCKVRAHCYTRRPHTHTHTHTCRHRKCLSGHLTLSTKFWKKEKFLLKQGETKSNTRGFTESVAIMERNILCHFSLHTFGVLCFTALLLLVTSFTRFTFTQWCLCCYSCPMCLWTRKIFLILYSCLFK